MDYDTLMKKLPIGSKGTITKILEKYRIFGDVVDRYHEGGRPSLDDSNSSICGQVIEVISQERTLTTRMLSDRLDVCRKSLKKLLDTMGDHQKTPQKL